MIGDIRQEAARRRAAPDFPVGEEAQLAVEMDDQGPGHAGADVRAVIAGLRPGLTNDELVELMASAIRVLSARLEAVERRLDRHQPDPDA